MEGSYIALLVFGILLMSIGRLWIVIAAFLHSFWWGIALIVFPCADFAFALENWREARVPLITWLAGLCLCIGAITNQPDRGPGDEHKGDETSVPATTPLPGAAFLPAPARRATSPQAQVAPVASPRMIATPAAFDLVATADGAAWFWAPPLDQGSAVRAVLLDAVGAVRGETLTVAELDEAVVDLEGAVSADRLGVVWVEPSRSGARLRGAIGTADGFDPPQTVGRLADRPRVPGYIELSADGARGFRAGWVAAREPCRDPEAGVCATLRFDDLPPARRSRATLSLPSACPQSLSAAVHTGGRHRFATCVLAGQIPTLALVTDGPNPQLSQTELGCSPIGGFALDDQLVVTGACQPEPSWARFGGHGRQTGTGTEVLACGDDGLVLAGRALRSDETVSGIESLLPAQAASTHARAVWTGQAVLVASVESGEATLRLWGCVEGRFARLGLL